VSRPVASSVAGGVSMAPGVACPRAYLNSCLSTTAAESQLSAGLLRAGARFRAAAFFFFWPGAARAAAGWRAAAGVVDGAAAAASQLLPPLLLLPPGSRRARWKLLGGFSASAVPGAVGASGLRRLRLRLGLVPLVSACRACHTARQC